MIPGLHLYYAYHAQHFTTAGEDLNDLQIDRDLSLHSVSRRQLRIYSR